MFLCRINKYLQLCDRFYLSLSGTQKVFKWLADVPEKAKERTIEKTQEGVSKITKLFKS